MKNFNCLPILALVVIVFSFWDVGFSQWIVAIAGFLILIRSVMLCSGSCNVESISEKKNVSAKPKKKATKKKKS